MDLDSIMELGHVVRVRPDHTVDDHVRDTYAPEVVVNADEDGQISAADDDDLIRSVRRQGWELVTGWTGQYGYHGPIMHPSEYVGGALAEHVLATPGLWVAVAVTVLDDGDSDDAGWVLAYQDKS